jgi:hypothetical protein
MKVMHLLRRKVPRWAGLLYGAIACLGIIAATFLVFVATQGNFPLQLFAMITLDVTITVVCVWRGMVIWTDR